MPSIFFSIAAASSAVSFTPEPEANLAPEEVRPPD